MEMTSNRCKQFLLFVDSRDEPVTVVAGFFVILYVVNSSFHDSKHRAILELPGLSFLYISLSLKSDSDTLYSLRDYLVYDAVFFGFV